ncbi:MAG: FIST N-terminal domain-containing protein [Pseudomonadota bacterium]
MRLGTFSFEPNGRWSTSTFPAFDSPQTLVMVFAAPEFIDEPSAISDLVEAYPHSLLIGCSSAGEIAGPFVNDASLSVAVLQFERTRISVVSQNIRHVSDSFGAGQRLARQLQHDDLRGVFILSDGLKVNGSELVDGLNSVLPAHVVITGGLAGDGNRFQHTWVIRNGKPETGVITATGFYGDNIRITHGSRGGWDSFGPERRVTRSSGNILYELDGKPALALYKDYLGERASGLPATALLFPLSIREDANDTRQMIRTVLAVDESRLSMTFAGDIPNGYLAQLMRANPERLLDSACAAANQAAEGIPASAPLLAVAISSVGRRLVLGERIEEETELVLKNLPAGARQAGFYSYGEISPCASGACDLHNQTMTLTTFSES